MSFIYDKNVGMVTTAGAFYHLKELLKTAGWQVKSSGDGISAFSSTGDIITNAGTGANGIGNFNSWYRIQMPSNLGVTREFLIQFNGTTTVNVLLYSYSTGFTGGSPSATSIPTATDSQNIRGSLSGILNDNSFHVNLGADNAAPYGFFMASHPIGNPNSAAGGGFVLDYMNENSRPITDPDPYVWVVPASNGFSISNLGSVSGGGAWYGKGTTAEIWATCQPGGLAGAGGNFMYPSQAGVNPHTFDEEVSGIIYGHGNSSPFTEPVQIKGVGYLMQWNGTRKQNGQLLTVMSAGDRLCIQDVNFPWDGTLVAV